MQQNDRTVLCDLVELGPGQSRLVDEIRIKTPADDRALTGRRRAT